jgi:hypothetical protein
MSIINGGEEKYEFYEVVEKIQEPLHYLHVLVKDFERVGKHELKHFDTFALPHTLH